ncbi:DUF7471 family protein [Halolamina salifodinae]|uniref:Heme A synthase n=1 Tax=Halolamina salifodinae TaxID=1202767 RepID=A0A8T4GWG9_9EURY|nr:hypothetical protein [Halolamina salifodinae]MBP1985648.1 heme A synthase [Halolamina salifodinae]
MIDGVPLAGTHGQDPVVFALLTLAGMLAAVVAGVAIAAFVRRRSRRYLLVALALSTLVGRSAVGLGAYGGMIGPRLHHQLEHGLDAAMAALVIAAVYLVGRPNRTEAARAGGDGEGRR